MNIIDNYFNNYFFEKINRWALERELSLPIQAPKLIQQSDGTNELKEDLPSLCERAIFFACTGLDLRLIRMFKFVHSSHFEKLANEEIKIGNERVKTGADSSSSSVFHYRGCGIGMPIDFDGIKAYQFKVGTLEAYWVDREFSNHLENLSPLKDYYIAFINESKSDNDKSKLEELEKDFPRHSALAFRVWLRNHLFENLDDRIRKEAINQELLSKINTDLAGPRTSQSKLSFVIHELYENDLAQKQHYIRVRWIQGIAIIILSMIGIYTSYCLLPYLKAKIFMPLSQINFRQIALSPFRYGVSLKKSCIDFFVAKGVPKPLVELVVFNAFLGGVYICAGYIEKRDIEKWNQRRNNPLPPPPPSTPSHPTPVAQNPPAPAAALHA